MRMLILLISFFITTACCACECVMMPLVYYIQKSDFIAKVKVLKVSEPTVDGQYQDAQIEILELFKGKKISTIRVWANLKTDCDLSVSENSTWLIFAQTNSSGFLRFDLCSGSLQLDRDFTSRNYPTAQNNWTESIDRKLAVLRYLKSNHLTSPNEYDLALTSIEQKDEHFRGYTVLKDRFAVFQITIEKNLSISKVKALKEFDNKALSDSLLSYLQINKKVNSRKVSGIKKRTKLIIIYYYYDADEKNKSFISLSDP